MQVLANKLISVNGFLVIPTLCTKLVHGFVGCFYQTCSVGMKYPSCKKKKRKENVSASEMTEYYTLKDVGICAAERKEFFDERN